MTKSKIKKINYSNFLGFLTALKIEHMKSNKLTYQLGLPEKFRHDAARLYDEAFGQKFGLIIKNREQRIAVLADSVLPGLAIVALEEDRLAGIAGFHENGLSFFGGGSIKTLFKHLGFFRGLRAALLFSFFERKPFKGDLLMEGIVVDPMSRGKGIGTGLIDKLTEYAKENGFDWIRLDVIDINEGARRLYERKGFVAVNTDKFPYLRRLIGFGAATTMMKYVFSD